MVFALAGDSTMTRFSATWDRSFATTTGAGRTACGAARWAAKRRLSTRHARMRKARRCRRRRRRRGRNAVCEGASGARDTPHGPVHSRIAPRPGVRLGSGPEGESCGSHSPSAVPVLARARPATLLAAGPPHGWSRPHHPAAPPSRRSAPPSGAVRPPTSAPTQTAGDDVAVRGRDETERLPQCST
jgi:hypothetical protein